MRRLLWWVIEIVVIVVCVQHYRAVISLLQQVRVLEPPRLMLPGIKPIHWYPCVDLATIDAKSTHFECAHVDVPLDYANHTGEKITLAVIRIPAQGQRIGAVFYNPGGPGGSGFDRVAQIGPGYVQKLHLEGFDFVGFDPRGVDRSGGLTCLTDEEIDVNLYRAYLWGFADACYTKYGEKLRFYSTENTARDMEVIRAAMGDTKISYFGVSYGTYLGAVYASMFPYRIRAMVLDSAFEPIGDSVEEQQLTQDVGFERAFHRWITWCETDPTCAFHSSDVGAAWDDLYASDHRLTVDGREINRTVILTATQSALYSKAWWRPLAVALANLAQHDGAAIIQIADQSNNRNTDATYKTGIQAYQIIMCASGIMNDAVPNPDAVIEQMHAQAPRMTQHLTADDIAGPANCAAYMDVPPASPIDYQGDAPILIVGGANDPATPIRWAIKMRDEMGPNAVLLTYLGEGHGPVGESTCVDAVAAALLNGLVLPSLGVSCAPDPEELP